MREKEKAMTTYQFDRYIQEKKLMHSQGRIVSDAVWNTVRKGVTELARSKFDEMANTALGGTTTQTCTTEAPPTLTLESMQEAMRPLKEQQEQLEDDATRILKQHFGIDVQGRGDLALAFLQGCFGKRRLPFVWDDLCVTSSHF